MPIVQCGTGALALIEVQAPSRRRMAAADYVRGRRIAARAWHMKPRRSQ